MSTRIVCLGVVIAAPFLVAPAHGQRISSGLVAYYPFTEGTGTVTTDQSVGTEDLQLSGAVNWLVGQNGLDFSGGQAGTTGAATGLIAALQATSQSTFEVWIVADDTTQAGPARFMSVGGDTSFQNFMFGQIGDNVQARLVHTAKAADATPRLTTADGFLTTALTHIVHTYDGATELLYVNGVQHPTTVVVAGDYSNWDLTDLLAIGNETTGTRPFNGVIRLAAVYDRPLSAGEVTQNFAAGPDVNATPVVDAGPNQTLIGTQTTTLAGSFVDDDLPVPQAGVTTTWTQVSGLGTATFMDDHDPLTEVSFDLDGLYVLQLAADDTLLTGSDTMIVGVNVPFEAFTDVTATATVAGPVHFGGHGAMWADVTGNDRPDLYVTMNFQPTDMAELFYDNVDGSVFAEEAALRGIDDFDSGSHGGVWGDLDNDGDYDLANGGYDRNRVWENDGVGQFTDRTLTSGLLDVNNGSRGSMVFDADGDGDLDLYFNNWGPLGEENEFYRNDGALQFTPIDNGLQFALGAQGITAGDVDNDGDLDVLFCRWTGDTGPLALYRNDGGVFTELIVPEFSVTGGVQDGITLVDANNDGWLDVHAKRGSGSAWLFLNDQDGTWTAAAVPTGPGYMGGFADLDNDGDWDLAYPGDTVVYTNDGTGVFTASTAFVVPAIDDPRAIAFADIDDDGDVDFCTAQKREFNMLMRNNLLAGPTRGWLKVRLVSPFGQAAAFGARVRLYEPGMLGDPAGLISFREAGSQDGYLSQSDPILHFGLGSRATVDVAVDFLEGTRFTQAGVTADQLLVVDVAGQPIRPEVDAGVDLVTPETPAASGNMTLLSGTLLEDGLNGNAGTVTFEWSVVSEPSPGATAFGNDTAIATTATFSTNGDYVLALTADNGSLTHTDTVAITANVTTDPAPVNAAPADLATGITVHPTLEIICPATTPLAAQFLIASDSAFTTVVYDSTLVLNEVCSQVVLDSLGSVQTYFWSARTQTPAGVWSAWSVPTQFSTTNAVLLSEVAFQDGVDGYGGTADTDLRGDFNNPLVPIREWNQGAQDILRTGRRRPGSFTDEIYRTLLRFDLTVMSDPDAVANVYLELTGTHHGGEDILFTTSNDFYEVLIPWGEGDGLVSEAPVAGEASWTYRAFPDTWTVPGVAGIGTDRAGTPVLRGNLSNIIGSKTRWSSVAFVNLVKGWIAAPASNQGLAIVASDESFQAVLNIASRQAVDVSTRPRLVIELLASDSCSALPDNDPCDDGNACTTGDTCQGGVCTAGAPVVCDDGLFCNGAESCDVISGCQAGTDPCPGQECDEPNDLCVDCLVDGDCDDSVFCNGAETCVANACQAGTDPCPGQECDEPNDLCVDCLVDGDCDDSVFCNGAETCVANTCQAGTDPCPGQECDEPNDLCVDCLVDGDCDDSVFCNGAETCVANLCQAGTDPCPGQECDEPNDLCVDCLIDGDCDDSVFCNGAETCVANACQAGTDPCPGQECDEPNDLCVDCLVDDDCDDSVFCNGAETCVANTCQAGTDPCPGQECDEPNDLCVDCLVDGDCDDSVFCNGAETCVANLCQAGTDPCPGQECDEPNDLCVDCLIDGDCDDSVFCNGAETCVANTCQAGTDPCPGQECDEPNDLCVDCLVDDDCDDSVFCNGAETCVANACQAGTDPCPGQECDEPNDLCVDCLVDDDCDDSVFCNGAETCVANLCQAGTDPCPGQECDEPNDLCVDCLVDGDCDDSVFCNGAETCVANTCQAGTDPCPGQECDEPNDLCVDCLVDGDCDDSVFCNGAETCVANTCQAGTDPCPGQECDEPNDLCVDCLVDGDCDDSVFCNGAETCVANLCQAGTDPCPGQECDEPNDLCVDCLVDADCDDSVFCNGAETCVANLCQAGTDPCPGQECDEPNDLCVDCLSGADCGACCVDGACSEVTLAECTSLGGTYLGNDTGCTPDPCAACTVSDMNDDGFCTIVFDVDLFVQCVYFGDCVGPTGNDLCCPADCNCDNLCTIVFDVDCFVQDIYVNGECGVCPGGGGPAPTPPADQFTIGGAVFSEEANPLSSGIAGVRVDLVNAAGALSSTTTTGPLGVWRMDGVATGGYTVRFGYRGLHPASIQVNTKNRVRNQRLIRWVKTQLGPRTRNRVP